MRRALWFLGLASVPALGQSVTQTILLPVPDPEANFPFGATVSPDGSFLLVPLSGSLGTPNNKVAVIDTSQERLLFRVPVGRFPEDAAVVTTPESPWVPREVYVTNSTDGTVSVLDGTFQPAAVIALGPSSYPFGVVASSDGRRVFVTSKGANEGPVFVIDSDPTSGTYRRVLQTLSIPSYHGRPVLHGSSLAVPHALPDFSHPGSPGRAWPQYSTVRVTILDPANPGDRRVLVLASLLPGYPSSEDLGVREDGIAFATTYGLNGHVHVLDLTQRAVLGSIDLNGWMAGASLMHGIGVSPTGHLGLVTSLNSDAAVLLDLEARVPLARIQLPPGARMGNEAVFLPDGTKAFVTMQDAPRVYVIGGLPAASFQLLSDRAEVPVGGELALRLRGGEARRPSIVAASLTGAGPTWVGPLQVALSPPILPLVVEGLDPAGRLGPRSLPIPPDPGLRGASLYLQAVTQDTSAGLRLSNPLRIRFL